MKTRLKFANARHGSVQNVFPVTFIQIQTLIYKIKSSLCLIKYHAMKTSWGGTRWR